MSLALDLPLYPESRIFLDDPSSTKQLLDLASSFEEELSSIDMTLRMEDVIDSFAVEELPFIDNKYSTEGVKDTAKRIFYSVKKRVKQLIQFLFSFFLKLFTGANDVKAIFKKYETKIKSYKKSFEKMNSKFSNNDKKMVIKDYRTRVLIPIILINSISGSLNLVLNYMQKAVLNKGSFSIESLVKITNCFQSVITVTSNVYDKTQEDSFSVKTFNSLSNLDSIKSELGKLLGQSAKKDLKTSVNEDNKEKLNAVYESLKTVYKENDVPTKDDLDYSEAYSLIYKTLGDMENVLGSVEKWDFKRISDKIQSIQPKLFKAVDNLSPESDAKYDDYLKEIMSIGNYMSSLTKIVNVSLKSFKHDLEGLFTEASRVGSTLYKV